MNAKTHSHKTADLYLELVKAFPLKPIRASSQYDRAGEVLAKLVVRPEGTLEAGEQDYMETLTMLVEAYDARHVVLQPRSTPLASLRYLMEQSGLKNADLARIIGSQPAASMILNGDRRMSKSHIRALAAHFKVDAGYFL